MPRIPSSNTRRSHRQADPMSSSNPSSRPRRSSVRSNQPQFVEEEDRFRSLRRSARIAQQQQQRDIQVEDHQTSVTMTDIARRTYARNDNGPRGVDTRTDYPSPSTPRSSSRPEPYTLTLLTTPPSTLSPNTPFTTILLITTPRPPTSHQLLCVASLVADTPSGARPLPAGYLQTTSASAKLMDSVQQASRAELARVPRERRGNVVGVARFEGLCVREAGRFRVRVTLARMQGDVYESVAEVDSPVFGVSGGVNGK